jgi:hypothetical protein
MIAELVEKAEQNCKEFPYYDMAHISNAIANKSNINLQHNAALFTQNNIWLHYLVNQEHFTETNEKATALINEENIVEHTFNVAPIVTEQVENNIKSVENVIVTEDSTVKKEELVPIEPYYTVDYFAAQGVKVQQSLQPTDKLGIQVKSFTDWLKTMKKMPLTKTEEIEIKAPVVDHKVVILAENSLLNTETLTETMAEVLVKQGKINDAIKVFEKLSLQDTTKSTYFAKRIKDLNN